MNYLKVPTLLLFIAFCWTGFAQNPQLKKADKLYKLNEYSQAISLYEEGLQEVESLSAKTNLAYCYMVTNRLNNAEQLYSEIVNEERARPITKYYYGETLMSNGKYDQAKNWFLKYAEQNPKDERALEMAAACDKVRLIKPLFENIEIKPFQQNSKSDDSGPVFYKDGIVFTSDRNSGVNPLKQKSGWTGRDFLRIYYSEADSTGMYNKPQGFSKKINEINKHCGPLSFNADQNYVVFTKTGIKPGKNDAYNMQLYYSESNDGTKWKKPKALPFCRKDHNYMHPALSADGETLYFVSDKPGGEGGTDIYKSKLTEKGWGTPLNLGTKVNTTFNEGFPFVGSEDKLYFCSKGHPGFGGFDIFVIEQDEKGLWSKLRNIGNPVNSSYDDISFHLDKTFTKGVFSSNRGGNDDNIYTFEVTSSTKINTITEEAEEVYVREALKPTANTENITSSEVAVEKTTMTNQNSNGTQNSGTAKDNTRMSGGEANDSLMENESFGESQQSIDVIENELVENNSDEFINEVVPDVETEVENIETINTEISSENTDNIGSETKLEVDETNIVHSETKKTENPSAKNNLNPIITTPNNEVTETQIRDDKSITLTPELFNDRPMPTVFPFIQMKYLLKKEVDLKGKTFRINGVQFEKGQYIVTPEIALKLNLLIDILEENPDLEIEIAAHTSSVGEDIENLEMSKARAGAIAAHLINRGISGDRINAEGYGENRLLNKCSNGINCLKKQHNVNERIELAIF